MVKGRRNIRAWGRRAPLFLLLLFFPLCLSAQRDSVTDASISTTARMIGVGGTNILDTYLSQEKFTGIGMSFLATIERQKGDSPWSTIIHHQAHISSTHDRNKSAEELEGSYAFFWGRYYSWKLLGERLKIQAGGLVNANIGFIYNTVNSNNPAQMRLYANIMPSAAATYHFPLWRRDYALRYEIDLPLAGVMFSPNYGQSYYEIFNRGNYDHNVVPTTLVSQPYFRQMLTMDINVSRRTTIRFGYLGDYQQAKVNQLKSHIYSHRFMVGFVHAFRLTHYRP